MINLLIEAIKQEFPTIELEVDNYSSGNVWLILRGFSRIYAIEVEYSPSQGFGVSLNDENTTPFGKHDHYFTNLLDTQKYLFQLIQASL